MNTNNKVWWLTVLRGIVLIILSFFVFRHPLSALVGVAVYIGVSLLITGIFQTGLAIFSQGKVENWGWVLTIGLIDILFGFILLSNPVMTAATLPFIVGFWIIVSGIMTFVNSFQSKKEGITHWWMGLIGGLISIVIGFVITNNVLAGMLAITYWMGLGFAIAGIFNVLLGFKLKP